MGKLNLSNKQRDRLSEILGNIAVAWFTAGVVSPLFIHPNSVIDFLQSLGISLIMTIAFLVGSLWLIIRVKK